MYDDYYPGNPFCEDDGFYYGNPADFNDSFYSGVGGINDTMRDNFIFSELNSIVGTVAKRALSQLKTTVEDNALLREISFYCIIFGIKLCLFIVLRNGAKQGFVKSF